MIEAFLAVLVGLSPVTALGWAVAAILAQRVWSLLREERATEARLRSQVEELQKINADIRVAAAEERVEDLKDLNRRYDITAKAILAALKKLGK